MDGGAARLAATSRWRKAEWRRAQVPARARPRGRGAASATRNCSPTCRALRSKLGDTAQAEEAAHAGVAAQRAERPRGLCARADLARSRRRTRRAAALFAKARDLGDRPHSRHSRTRSSRQPTPPAQRCRCPALLKSSFDPLVRLLLLAIVLASVLPVRGRAHDVAQCDLERRDLRAVPAQRAAPAARRGAARHAATARLLLPLALWCFGAMALAGWGCGGSRGASLPTVALGLPLPRHAAVDRAIGDRLQARWPAAMWRCRWSRRRCSTSSACSSPRRCSRCWRKPRRSGSATTG